MIYHDVNDVLMRVQEVTEFLGIQLKTVNQTGIFGNTPLAVVSTWNDLRAAEMLINAGADLNLIIEDGDTVLHRAVSFGHADLVELLFEQGAAVDIRNNDGATPLDIAVSGGQAQIVQILSKRAAKEDN
jgi:ankyrin repeat protein